MMYLLCALCELCGSPVHQNPARGGGKIIDNRIGLEVGTAPDLGGAGAAPDENAPRPHCLRQADIDPLVADHERAGGIEVEVACGAIDQAGRRLAAVAGTRISGDAAVGMMRT